MSEPEAEAPTRSGWSHLGPGTLGRRLVVRVTAIVAAVAILLSVITLLGLRQVLYSQLDEQVRSAAQRQQRDPRGPGQEPDEGPAGVGAAGNTIGTIFVTDYVDQNGQTWALGQIIREGMVGQKRANLPVSVTTQLVNLPADGRIRTVRLEEGLGRYRVLRTSHGTGGSAAALPVADVDRAVGQVALIESILVLLAIGVSLLATSTVVRRSLRPLNHLAGTANAVSTLQLDRGEVALDVRAPEPDPRSEVGQVSRAFNLMLNNVEQALASRQQSESRVRQFVADASHELRNPLASIRGYAELTRRDRDGLPSGTAFAMDRIESESARMSRLVEDMLLLARLDDDPTLATTTVDVSEVVLNAVSDARVAGPEHRWQLRLPDDPQLALGEPHRMQQVVANLLSNARKHTPPGTTVTASVTTAEDRILVTVADDGPGIDAAVLPTVFERFARADSARRHSSEPSTGLGLAIVSAVMAAHGGTVDVRSSPGHTEFRLTFPAAPVSAEASPLGAVPDLADEPGPDATPPGA